MRKFAVDKKTLHHHEMSFQVIQNKHVLKHKSFHAWVITEQVTAFKRLKNKSLKHHVGEFH